MSAESISILTYTPTKEELGKGRYILDYVFYSSSHIIYSKETKTFFRLDSAGFEDFKSVMDHESGYNRKFFRIKNHSIVAEEEDDDIWDTIANPKALSPELCCVASESVSLLLKAIEKLEPVKRYVIKGYLDYITESDLAKACGLSQANISYLKRNAIRDLTALLKHTALEDMDIKTMLSDLRNGIYDDLER